MGEGAIYREGLITAIVRLIFQILKKFSVMYALSYFSKNYVSRGDLPPDKVLNRQFANRRMIFIDAYILSWIVAEAVMSVVALRGSLEVPPRSILVGLCALRVIEIYQVLVNAVLFDPLTNKKMLVVSRERIIVLSLVNYAELILLFGVIYALHPSFISGDSPRPIQGFYLSAITHFTIGYGDIYPKSQLRIVAALQGFCGTVFVVLIFARFMGTFASIRVLSDEERNEKLKEDNSDPD